MSDETVSKTFDGQNTEILIEQDDILPDTVQVDDVAEELSDHSEDAPMSDEEDEDEDDESNSIDVDEKDANMDAQNDSVQAFVDHKDSIFSVAISPTDLDLVATGGGDDVAYLWRISTGEAVVKIEGIKMHTYM